MGIYDEPGRRGAANLRDPNPWGWPTCLDCGRIFSPEDGINRDGSCPCCYDGHETETTDEADGVRGGGAAHVWVTRCLICGEVVEPDD